MSDERGERLKNLSPEQRGRVLEALKRHALAADAPIPRRATDLDRIPLSYAQQRLWLTEQREPGGRAYNELAAIRITGRLDVRALEHSLSEIVRRHEALRTTFPSDGEPMQVIAPAGNTPLAVRDLRALPLAERDAELCLLVDAEGDHVFDLARGPLLRLTLIRLADEISVLAVAAHHIVLDGWSVGILRRELSALYLAFAQDLPSPLPELPIQYADFALWQRGHLDSGRFEGQVKRWTEQFHDLPPRSPLPITHRSALLTTRGARHHFTLDPELSATLKGLSRREDVTLFMTLLAGLQILLHRYTRDIDIPIATAIANRERAELEGVIGFFVNTLLLRGDLSGSPSVRELLQRVSRTARDAYDHADIPFDAIVDALRAQGSMNDTAPFHAYFTLLNTPKHDLEIPGLEFHTLEIEKVTAKFELILSMEEGPDGLRGYWQYSTDLFDEPTIVRMTDHLATLLRAMVADPDRSISMLPLLGERERERLDVWNRTKADTPQATHIHALFEAQVERTPDAIAVTHAGQHVSYRELDQHANRIARRLRAAGVDSGLVGVFLEPCVDQVASLLGVLKAGAAYVPLDPSYPSAWITNVLADAKVVAVLTNQALVRALPTHAPTIRIDTPFEDDGAPLRATNDLAYVIYTSGSTGEAKGVLVSHANVIHSTVARWEYYREPVTSFLLLSSVAFDSSVAGLFWTLTGGGMLVLRDSSLAVDIPTLCELVRTHRVSHLLAIPSLYGAILDEGRPAQLASLRTVIVAGETCPSALVNDHLRRLGRTALFNEYGPTEATVWATVYRCDSRSSGAPIPIGRPISRTRCYVLDEHRQSVPIGVPGELYIAGDGVARGYHHRPDASDERFLTLGGERMYKTGDIVRLRADGELELVGRADQQVKIRGVRIELGAVEAALLRDPALREAAVVHEAAGVIAYVVVGAGGTLSFERLERSLAELLPSQARPTQIKVIAQLPRLPNGKIDRARLPELSTSLNSGTATTQDDPEWTDLEREIAEIWKSVLNLESVGRRDNFFKIGGSSLTIIRVYNRLRQITDKRLAITDLFKNPTIQALAALIGPNTEVGEV